MKFKWKIRVFFVDGKFHDSFMNFNSREESIIKCIEDVQKIYPNRVVSNVNSLKCK